MNESDGLLSEVCTMIEQAKASVAVAVNTGLTMLYWQVGRRIHTEILKEDRAGYGDEIVATLSRQLEAQYGRGFSAKNIRHMIKMTQAFSDPEIVSTLSRQLSWSHFKEIIYLEKPLQREFYAEMCRIERWSVRALRERIKSMLYERTAISRKPDELIQAELQDLREQDRMTPDLVFKDPYFLDFLNLSDHYYEKDLEDAILRELERFLLEMGQGFAFIARQKRIQVDVRDYYMDLLFYHRHLKRLIVIDLKLGDFEPEYKGQMELYLRWLKKHETLAGEQTPLGIILCAGKQSELIELLELDQSGIHVAEYLTELPPRQLLEAKLQSAVEKAREKWAQQLIQGKNGEPDGNQEE